MFRVPILAVGLLTAVGSLSNARESVAKSMTVADAIETTRFMRAAGGAGLYGAHYLHKPVELYVGPNIDRGTHDSQNPEQCYVSQQGAVDWFVKYLHP
jgi:hypothetical protein